MNHFFSADHHLSHKNIIKYCNRPFTFEQHDDELIKRWNERVTNEDRVYHLGDFSWCPAFPILERLNFRSMIWILGNHDRKVKEGIMSSKGRDIKICRYMEEISVNGQEITLCHYSMRRWNKSHYGTWHLYGHSHGTLPPYRLSMDVGVDAHDFYPVSFEEVKKFMNEQLASHKPEDLGLLNPINHFD